MLTTNNYFVRRRYSIENDDSRVLGSFPSSNQLRHSTLMQFVRLLIRRETPKAHWVAVRLSMILINSVSGQLRERQRGYYVVIGHALPTLIACNRPFTILFSPTPSRSTSTWAHEHFHQQLKIFFATVQGLHGQAVILTDGPWLTLITSPVFEFYYLERFGVGYLFTEIFHWKWRQSGVGKSSLINHAFNIDYNVRFQVFLWSIHDDTVLDHRPFLTESVAYATSTRKSLPPKTLYLLFMTLRDLSLAMSPIWPSSRNFFESEVRMQS